MVQSTGDECDLGVGYLSFSAGASKLEHRFVEEADSMEPAFCELPTGRVHGELAPGSDPVAALDPVTKLAKAAEAEGFDP